MKKDTQAVLLDKQAIDLCDFKNRKVRAGGARLYRRGAVPPCRLPPGVWPTNSTETRTQNWANNYNSLNILYNLNDCWNSPPSFLSHFGVTKALHCEYTLTCEYKHILFNTENALTKCLNPFKQHTMVILQKQLKIPTNDGLKFKIKQLIPILEQWHNLIPTCVL